MRARDHFPKLMMHCKLVVTNNSWLMSTECRDSRVAQQQKLSICSVAGRPCKLMLWKWASVSLPPDKPIVAYSLQCRKMPLCRIKQKLCSNWMGSWDIKCQLHVKALNPSSFPWVLYFPGSKLQSRSFQK